MRTEGIEQQELERLVPSWDDDNTQWRDYAESNVPLTWEFNPELGRRLEGARYWAVYLAPPEDELHSGGDYWVFISKEDLHVIGQFGGA